MAKESEKIRQPILQQKTLQKLFDCYYCYDYLFCLVDHELEMHFSNSFLPTWFNVPSPGCAFDVDENTLEWIKVNENKWRQVALLEFIREVVRGNSLLGIVPDVRTKIFHISRILSFA